VSATKRSHGRTRPARTKSPPSPSACSSVAGAGADRPSLDRDRFEIPALLDEANGDDENATAGTNTCDVVVEGVDNGVGAFEVTVTSSDTGVGTTTGGAIAALAAGRTYRPFR
jgi:hypothetical protein